MLDHANLLNADESVSFSQPNDANTVKLRQPLSPARLAANQANALKSTGPRTPEGKQRSASNATRHGALGQIIPLSDDERPVYEQFLADYAAAFSPANAVEKQLAYAAADLQFRLNRLAATEHQLFQDGLSANTNPEALTFAASLARCKDPLATLSIYEQRLNRRLLQTLKELRSIQLDRRNQEIEHSNEMINLGLIDPSIVEGVHPSELGFVCSSDHFTLAWKRQALVNGPHLHELRREKAADRARYERKKLKAAPKPAEPIAS